MEREPRLCVNVTIGATNADRQVLMEISGNPRTNTPKGNACPLNEQPKRFIPLWLPYSPKWIFGLIIRMMCGHFNHLREDGRNGPHVAIRFPKAKAIWKRAARGDPIPEGESDLQKVDIIGERGSFSWIRPDHMEPTGELSSKEVRETLHRQRDECLVLLERIRAGVGALCHIKMTVNDLGKIDLYQWLYFLVQHAHRHLQQMAEIEKEFSAESPQSG